MKNLINKFLAVVVGLVWALGGGAVSEAKEQVKFLQELRAELQKPVDSVIAPNGDIYVLDQEIPRVFIYGEDGRLKISFGQEGSAPGHFRTPSSLALTKQGELLVADTGNSRIQVFSPKGQFLYQLGNSGSNPGEFRAPVSVAVDQMGFIYVADAVGKSITTFSPNGVFLRMQELNHTPQDIAFDLEQNLYILMPEIEKIVKFSIIEGVVKELDMKLVGTGSAIKDTVSFTVDFRGDIYLIDDKSHGIKKFDQEQKLLFSFGSQGVGRGQFDKPSGIIADERGRVLVADSKNKRIQILEITGSAKPALQPTPAISPVLDYAESIQSGSNIVDLSLVPQLGLFALSDMKGQVLHSDLKSARMTAKIKEDLVRLENPQALWVLNEGKMLVADTGNDQLQFLSENGAMEYHFGKKGKRAGEFSDLSGVAVDREGYIYIADSLNHRIQVFNSDGIYLREFGQKSQSSDSPEQGNFASPQDLAFDSLGQLYVLDAANKRIQVFDREGKFVKEIGGMKDKVRFHEPVDIALDEKDYLYVADRGRHVIQIIDNQGKWLMDFGSAGMGPSHFPRLSSIAAMEGKIYVADYDVNKIQVFNFNPSGIPQAAQTVKADEQPIEEELAAQEPQTSPVEAVEAIQEKVEEVMAKVEEAPAVIAEAVTALVTEAIEYKLSDDQQMLFVSKASSPLRLEDATKASEIISAREALVNMMIQDLSTKFRLPEEPIRKVIKMESAELLESKQLKVTVSIPRRIEVEDQISKK